MSYEIGAVVKVTGNHTMEGQIGRVCRATKYTYWVRFWVISDDKKSGSFYVPIPRDMVKRAKGSAPRCINAS